LANASPTADFLATEAISQILQYKWKKTAWMAYMIMLIYTGYLAVLIWWEDYWALVCFTIYFILQEAILLRNVAMVACKNEDRTLILTNYLFSFGFVLNIIRIGLLVMYLS
jgi:hypothetical protein